MSECKPWGGSSRICERGTKGCDVKHKSELAALPGSAFMVRAVHAYHRSEQDAFALLFEALGTGKAEEWPHASSRLRRNRNSNRLWFWACKRWGVPAWPQLEYRIRESKQNPEITDA